MDIVLVTELDHRSLPHVARLYAQTITLQNAQVVGPLNAPINAYDSCFADAPKIRRVKCVVK